MCNTPKYPILNKTCLSNWTKFQFKPKVDGLALCTTYKQQINSRTEIS